MSPKDLEAIADSLETYANRLRELAEVAKINNQAVEDVAVPATSMSHDPGTTLNDVMKSFPARCKGIMPRQASNNMPASQA